MRFEKESMTDGDRERLDAAWDDLDRAWRELEAEAFGPAADFAQSAVDTLRRLQAVRTTRRVNVKP
jgi:hypothetical protein